MCWIEFPYPSARNAAHRPYSSPPVSPEPIDYERLAKAVVDELVNRLKENKKNVDNL